MPTEACARSRWWWTSGHTTVIRWSMHSRKSAIDSTSSYLGCEAYVLLVTNLPRERVSADQVGQTYRLRWQVELLFKEWKSHANLRGFDTANEHIAEGLVWAALAAAALKRHIGHATQALRRVEVSTRKVAMCARHGLDAVLQAIASGKHRALPPAIRNLIEYLARNAKRSHPRRDRQRGRLQFGLEPVLGSA